ncbi:FHA domain-containing protein [Verrucomicrobiota bacterium]
MRYRLSEKPFMARGHLEVNGVLAHIHADVHHATTGESLDFRTLKTGQEVGLYMQWAFDPVSSNAMLSVPAAIFVDPMPSAETAEKGSRTLEESGRIRTMVGFLFFSVVAGIIGLFLGITDGVLCRQFRRALLCGIVGLLVGLVGGFCSGMFANIVYAPLSRMAYKMEGMGGMAIHMLGRTVAWCVGGMAMGLGQGIALRSRKLFTFGFLGGLLGGTMGGLIFDPIGIVFGSGLPSGFASRLVGLLAIGLFVGLAIGVVELLARDAWLKMLKGPLAGKEFLVFKDVMYIGASPRSDVYLFGDASVDESHAVMRSTGDFCEIESLSDTQPLLINSCEVRRARLRSGDQIGIGGTIFLYQERKKTT